MREQTETLEKVNHIGRLPSSELDLQRLVQAVTDEATHKRGPCSIWYRHCNSGKR